MVSFGVLRLCISKISCDVLGVEIWLVFVFVVILILLVE